MQKKGKIVVTTTQHISNLGRQRETHLLPMNVQQNRPKVTQDEQTSQTDKERKN